MAQSFTISMARQKFFALFQTVTGRRGRKVVITSRGSELNAVLVGEAYLDELEAAAKRLRDIESGKADSASDFKLIGSGRVAESDGDPHKHIRSAANASHLTFRSLHAIRRLQPRPELNVYGVERTRARGCRVICCRS